MSHTLVDIFLYGVLLGLCIVLILLFMSPEYQEFKDDLAKIKKKAQKECGK